MNKASIIYVSENIPEKDLEKTSLIRYYPPTEMREVIFNDVKEHLKCDLSEYVVEVKVEVILKLYKTNNDTKNS